MLVIALKLYPEDIGVLTGDANEDLPTALEEGGLLFMSAPEIAVSTGRYFVCIISYVYIPSFFQ